MIMPSKPIELLSETLLGKPHHELEPEEIRVLESIQRREPLARDAADVADSESTFGQKLSDRVAAVGGSWSFIIAFAVVLFGWMLLNTDVLSHLGIAFDPYPFIFLNLMLSTLAAIQAPIIMMSQNRQAAKDRTAAALDFEVNLRAELEILRLHSKVDDGVMRRLDEVIAAQSELADELRTIKARLPQA